MLFLQYLLLPPQSALPKERLFNSKVETFPCHQQSSDIQLTIYHLDFPHHSEAGAVRLYAKEIVSSLVEGLGSSQWTRKRTCAEAVVQLTQVRLRERVGGLSLRDVEE
jgi:hypothetical protein